ncbi:MAG: PilZ domain-containing protein [Vulcanimicrobiota bacterium]
MQALDEPTVYERLDRVFGREWAHSFSCARCATFTFPVEGNAAGNVSLHFWRTKCVLDVPIQGAGTALKVAGDYICAADEYGAFLLNHKASFLTTALKELGVGSDDALIRNSYLSFSPSVSVLYLTGFDTNLQQAVVVEKKPGNPVFSFLEYSPISDLFVRVYRVESMTILSEDGECSKSVDVYLLTLDHRGIAFLSFENFSRDAVFDFRLASQPSLKFEVDSVEKTELLGGVFFYYMNFDHFLSEKIINTLKQNWGNERRASVRIQKILPVKITLSRYKSLYALTDDISIRGMRIVHKHAIPPGIHFDCQIRLASVFGDINLKSVPVWKKTLMSTLNITGVEFLENDPGDLKRLRDYLESEIVTDFKSAVFQNNLTVISQSS